MPRDATGTRARLLEEAERIFARRGVFQATMREITEAAGQRNASALTYHFTSREGVLWAILERHAEPLDAERGALIAGPLESMSTRAAVAALVVPYARRVSTPEGRNYLRIVAQLTHLFPVWRSGPLTSPHLRDLLALLESRAGGATPAVRAERVIAAVMLITAAMAERARVEEEGGAHALDDGAFLANLADVLVAGLEAEPGPPLAPAPRVTGRAPAGRR